MELNTVVKTILIPRQLLQLIKGKAKEKKPRTPKEKEKTAKERNDENLKNQEDGRSQEDLVLQAPYLHKLNTTPSTLNDRRISRNVVLMFWATDIVGWRNALCRSGVESRERSTLNQIPYGFAQWKTYVCVLQLQKNLLRYPAERTFAHQSATS